MGGLGPKNNVGRWRLAASQPCLILTLPPTNDDPKPYIDPFIPSASSFFVPSLSTLPRPITRPPAPLATVASSVLSFLAHAINPSEPHPGLATTPYCAVRARPGQCPLKSPLSIFWLDVEEKELVVEKGQARGPMWLVGLALNIQLCWPE